MKRRSAVSVAFPRTSPQAKAVVEAAATRTEWHDSADGQTRLYHPNDDAAPRAGAALVIVRTSQAETRAQATLKRQVEKAEHQWKQKLWHLSNQHFAYEADAQSILARELKGLPVWLEVQSEFVSSEHHPGRGRPRKDATPAKQWHIQATVTIKQPQVEQEVRRKACFIVATNVLDSTIRVFARSGEHL